MTGAEEFEYTGKDELLQQQSMPRYNKHIADLFLKKITPGMRVIDFGAGIGTISDIVKKHAGVVEITCIEIDNENVKALQDKGYHVVSDISTLPDDTFDVIYSSNVLEHIEHDVDVLKQLRKKLKPGGQIAFWVPAFQMLWTAMDDRVEHFRRYTKTTMRQIFEDAGYRVDSCFYQDSAGFFVTLLYKYIGKQDGTVNVKTLQFYDNIIFPLSKLADFVFSSFFGKNVFIYARKG